MDYSYLYDSKTKPQNNISEGQGYFLTTLILPNFGKQQAKNL